MLKRVLSMVRMGEPHHDDGGLLFDSGATVPTDATAGYRRGCLFQHTDGADGSSLYVNEGSVTSCDFNALDGEGTINHILGASDTFSWTCTDVSAPIVMTNTMTTAGKTGCRALFNVKANVALGAWCNGLKGYMEFTGTSGATTGLASGVCAELKTPNRTLPSGAYYPLEVEHVAGGTSVVSNGSGSRVGFMFLQNSTDLNGDFDDNGYLMTVAGLTAGAGHILSAQSITMKMQVGLAGAEATRYLVMSTTENSLVLATTSGTSIEVGTCTTGLNFNGTITTDISFSSGGTIKSSTNTLTFEEATLTFTGATKINLDGATDVTGILTVDTAGSPADGVKISATTPTDGLEISSACGSHAINISGAQTGAGITVANTCGTYGLNVAGACTTAGIGILGAEAIGLLISTSTPTVGVSITANCETAGISISGTQVLGTLFHATGAATAAHSVTVPTGITLGAGLDINVTSVGIVTSGLTMQGTGTFTTGITLSATAITTGIAISAGSLTDGILISGTTPVDGIQISSACSGYGLNISGSCATGILATGTARAIDAQGKVRVGTHDWGVGATGVLMNGTDDDMAFIVAARINADVGAGAYSATYTQMAVTVTQTGSTTSIFGTWSELYIGGSGITAVMNANGAGVWGHIEASGTSITFGGGASYHAGLVGTLLSTASATVIQAGSYLSGCHVDTNVATSGFSNSGVYAAFSCVTGAGKQAWEHGLYIDGAESVIGVASASAYEDGVKIVDGEAGDAGVSGKVGYDALAKFMIGGTTYYIALFDADSVTGE